MQPSGFNPMRWDCGKSGCFNTERRPKIEVFADCFPRRINFGDVDGLVELNGRFLLLEWKGPGGSLRQGQIRTYIEFTSTVGNLVLVVCGSAKTMAVESFSQFWGGRHLPSMASDLDGVKSRIRRWAEWTQQAKVAA